MLKGCKYSNDYFIGSMKGLAVWAIIIVLVSIGACNLKQNSDFNKSLNSEIPLLLSSGSTTADYADIGLTLWFKNSIIPDLIWAEKPTPDWTWVRKELKTTHDTAITLSGTRKLNKSQEEDLFKWYTTMAPIIEKAGGRVYFEERVPQVIDVAGFLSKGNTEPAQWMLSGNLISVAAYQSKLKASVLAGPDRINVQLASRGDSKEGQTVLAVPVLLNEF